MLKSFCFLLPVLILSAISAAQTPGAEFGCSGRSRFFVNTDLRFAPLNNPEAVRAWDSRQGTTFDGFDEQKFGFASVVIYGWRAPLRDKAHPATGLFLIAVRLIGARGEQWFQVVPQPADKLLFIDRPLNADERETDAEDKEDPVTIVSATPDSTLPLFVLAFNYQETANYASGTVSNHLLLDLRSGTPRIEKAVQCTQWESSGVCGALENSSGVYDNLRCNWEPGAGDFHCTMIRPFGSPAAVRAASKDFYLFSGRLAQAAWYTPETPPDAASLAAQLARDANATEWSGIVPQLGPVTMVGRYRDLLSGSEVFAFASPGAGDTTSAAFTLVIVPAQGSPMAQNVPVIDISGQSASDGPAPVGYTPLSAGDTFRVAPLEDRTGFHALQAVMSSGRFSLDDTQQEPGIPVHVLYWLGLEAVQGKIVASAVRVATEAARPGSCAQELHETSAISLEPQPGMAAATVHVRPTELLTTRQNVQQPVCVAIGALYWKQGSGFVTQKTSQDCNEPIPEIAITEDGQITPKVVESPE